MKFDALYFSADLCFKNGMLFSPQVYRDHIMPIHREYRKFCDEHDMFFMLHCDGDVRGFIPLVIESGFHSIEPLEARAGNDVRLLKALYGDKKEVGRPEGLWIESCSPVRGNRGGGAEIGGCRGNRPSWSAAQDLYGLCQFLKKGISI